MHPLMFPWVIPGNGLGAIFRRRVHLKNLQNLQYTVSVDRTNLYNFHPRRYCLQYLVYMCVYVCVLYCVSRCAPVCVCVCICVHVCVFVHVCVRVHMCERHSLLYAVEHFMKDSALFTAEFSACVAPCIRLK